MAEQKIEMNVYPSEKGPAEIRLRQGSLPIPYQYQGYSYTLESIQSVIDLITSKGSKENTVIFVDEKGIQVILDDTITGRPKDTGQYKYLKSLDYKEWDKVLGHRLNQKQFIEFLKRRPEGEIKEFDYLFASAQKLSLATVITGDYEYEDNNNLVVNFKIKDSESTTRLPKFLLVTLPLIQGSEQLYEIEVEMEFSSPRNEGEKPGFTLTIPKFERYWHQAVEDEAKILKESLEGYLILSGQGLR